MERRRVSCRIDAYTSRIIQRINWCTDVAEHHQRTQSIASNDRPRWSRTLMGERIWITRNPKPDPTPAPTLNSHPLTLTLDPGTDPDPYPVLDLDFDLTVL